jgi:hypothetical protein
LFTFAVYIPARAYPSSEYDELISTDTMNDDLKGKFEKFRMKFMKDQSEVVKGSEKSMNKYKSDRDGDIRSIQYRMAEVQSNIADSNDEMKESLKEKIAKINDATADQFEALKEEERMLENEMHINRTKLEEDQGYYETLKVDDVDGVFGTEERLIKISQQLASVDQSYQEKSQRILEKMSSLRTSAASALNNNYKMLVDVYEKEEKKIENMNTMSDLKDEMLNEWKEYAQSVEGEQTRMTTQLKEMSSNMLTFDTVNNIDAAFDPHNYSVIYDMTRFLVPKEMKFSTICSAYINDKDDFIATDCGGIVEDKIELEFDWTLYSCLKSSDEVENYTVYRYCSIRGEFEYAPCKGFMKEYHGIITGIKCSNDVDSTVINTNGYNYKCKTLIKVDSSHYQYGECSKIFNGLNDYIVDVDNTRFMIPHAKYYEEEVKCEKFTTRINDELYAGDCREFIDDLPKAVTFNGKVYSCAFIKTEDTDLLIYFGCEEGETTTTTTAASTTVEPGHEIVIPMKYIEGSNRTCMFYIMDNDGDYQSLGCQYESVDRVYIYNGFNQYDCASPKAGLPNNVFTECEVVYSDQIPTSLDLDIDFYTVSYKTWFYIPIGSSFDDKINPCGSFTYKLHFEDKVFATNCLERPDYEANSLIFMGKVYDCSGVGTSSDYPGHYYLTRCKYSNDLGYQWIKFKDTVTHVPRNAVIGGYDADGKTLHVIRKVYSDNTLYGKSVNENSRKNGYLTDSTMKEFSVHDYEVSLECEVA